MPARVANCPNCGGEVEFKAGASLLSVCPYCSSAVARVGGDVGELEILGKVAPLADLASPLSLGVAGKSGKKAFTIVGRIQLDYGLGPWNEWYVAFDDGAWGWLAEAQGKVYLTQGRPISGLPDYGKWKVGTKVTVGGQALTVVERRKARFISAEGELPFAVAPGTEFKYCDLQGADGAFGTVDFGDGDVPEQFFAGRELTYDALFGKDVLGKVAPARAAETAGLNCPNCGASVALRAPSEAQRVTCPSCESLLDASRGHALYLLSSLKNPAPEPKIPLGSTGQYLGAKWTVIGQLVRSVTVDHVRYPWEEYLLHAAGRGYRWLTVAGNHWSWIEPANAGDVLETGLTLRFRGKILRHFQSGTAVVDALRGEFYWKVAVGERTSTSDWVAPPLMLSSEQTSEEVTWSSGQYLRPEDVEAIFPGALKKRLGATTGIAPNQPNPYTAPRRSLLVLATAFTAALAVLGMLVAARADGKRVYLGTHSLVAPPPEPGASADPAPLVVLTEPFTIDRRSNLRVRVNADVDNTWFALGGALINETTNEVRQFSVDVSYYHGYAEGESWAEGSAADSIYLGGVSPGTYLFRFEPQTDRACVKCPSSYTVEARTNVFLSGHLFLFLFLLWLIPVVVIFLHSGFERRRWADSDHS